MQVEVANKLICDLLQAISTALTEFQETARKYSLDGKTESSAALPGRAGGRDKAAAGLSKVWETTKVFSKHVAYVLVEKGAVEQLVQRLSGLNDSLEKLLTLSQKVQFATAMSSGVLVNYQDPAGLRALLSVVDTPQASTNPTSTTLVASAHVKQLCIEMDLPEKSGPGAGGEARPPTLNGIPVRFPLTPSIPFIISLV